MDENQMKLRGDGIEQGKQKQIKWDMDEKSKHFKFQVGQSSFGLFHNILWKNPDELFGQSMIQCHCIYLVYKREKMCR